MLLLILTPLNKSVQQSRAARGCRLNENIWGHFKNNTVPLRAVAMSSGQLQGWGWGGGCLGARRAPPQPRVGGRGKNVPPCELISGHEGIQVGKKRRNHREVEILAINGGLRPERLFRQSMWCEILFKKVKAQLSTYVAPRGLRIPLHIRQLGVSARSICQNLLVYQPRIIQQSFYTFFKLILYLCVFIHACESQTNHDLWTNPN